MKRHIEVPAELRENSGKGASRRLRRAGRIPAVVYGGDRAPAALTLDHDFIRHAATEEAFHVSILELKVGDGRTQKVVLRDLQRHPFKQRIAHADFLRVSEDHELRIDVPIHFINEEKSPAGRMAGVVISHQVTEVEISALPKDLPEYLEVDLIDLEAGDSVMLSEIPLPEGVRIPALQVSSDNDVSVVAALYIRETQGEGVLAAEADAALAAAEDLELVDEAEAEAEGEEVEGEEVEGEEAEGEDETAESGGADSKEHDSDRTRNKGD